MPGRFRAEPVVIDGQRFASKKEARRYGELRTLQLAGEIKNLTCHPAYPVAIAGFHFCTYTPDFRYEERQPVRRFSIEANGDPATLIQWVPVIEEIKSSGTRKDAAYRLRRKAAELFHGIKVVEVLK